MKYDIYTEIINNIKCLASSEEINLILNGIDFKFGHDRIKNGISKSSNDMIFKFYGYKSPFAGNSNTFGIVISDRDTDSKKEYKLSCRYDDATFSWMECYLKIEDGVDFFEIKKDGDRYILESKYYDREAEKYINNFYNDESYHNYSKMASLHGIVPDIYVSRELTKEEAFTTINNLIRNPKEISESLFVENKEPVAKKKIKQLKPKTTN